MSIFLLLAVFYENCYLLLFKKYNALFGGGII